MGSGIYEKPWSPENFMLLHFPDESQDTLMWNLEFTVG